MSSHPDADAFMRGYLREPTDTTARLVFADWLEETGTPWNRAWAHYIRLKARAESFGFGTTEWKELEARAAEYAPHVRANLTIAAGLFVGYPKSLLQLLPGPNITVTVGDHDVPRAVVEFVPESVARENLMLPLDLQGPVLIAAAAEPEDVVLAERLEFILAKDVVLVRAESADIVAAINRHYGETETESVDSIHWIFPIEFDISPGAAAGYGDEPPEVVEFVNAILREARSRGARRALLSPIGGFAVRFREEGEWSGREPLPAEQMDPAAWRVARMVDDRWTYQQTGRAGGRFLCRLGTDRFLVRAAIESLEEGPAVQFDLAADDTLDIP